jgi:hypothetical protein
MHKTVNVPLVLYGCETRSITLGKNHVLKVTEKVQGRVFEPKREEMLGEWRKLHEELRNLYASPNIVRVIK